jgi:hypothetical protein
VLVAVGVACLAGYGWQSHRSRQLEAESRRAATQMLAMPDDFAEDADVPTVAATSSGIAEVIGEINIPRLELAPGTW